MGSEAARSLKISGASYGKGMRKKGGKEFGENE
jgi:hypothetical protein